MVQAQKTFSRTLDDLDKLANSEFIKADFKQIKSEDYRHLCAKKIEEFSDRYFKTRDISF